MFPHHENGLAQSKVGGVGRPLCQLGEGQLGEGSDSRWGTVQGMAGWGIPVGIFLHHHLRIMCQGLTCPVHTRSFTPLF